MSDEDLKLVEDLFWWGTRFKHVHFFKGNGYGWVWV